MKKIKCLIKWKEEWKYSLIKINYFHPFHIVTYRIWPLLQSLSLIIILIGILKFLNFKEIDLLCIGLLLILICIIQWWRDVIRESTFQGFHTKEVLKGIKFGIILFIISELFFFFSFFWAFFHMRLSPSIEIGIIWPPKGIEIFNPFIIPLLNTFILVSSGVTVTLRHLIVLYNKRNKGIGWLSVTIYLGLLFRIFQGYEYFEANYSIRDSVYGSVFYILTGFHGLHVIIGTLFLLIIFFRIKNKHFSWFHHFGFEAACWYWHFVDVVWLFLYLLVYWWIYYLFSIKNIFNFQLKDLINFKISNLFNIINIINFYIYFIDFIRD